MLNVCVQKTLGYFKVDMSFAVEKVGITALWGRSGAGKTSLVNMVAGLDRPDELYIAINDRFLFDSHKGIDLPPEERRIGYVFQEGRLFPHFSVRSNLTYGRNLIPPHLRFVHLDTVVSHLGLTRLLSRRPAKLSGGEKQRVAIGRALLTSPSLLLMDEPLVSLDSARKAEILPFIKRLSHEFCIILTSTSRFSIQIHAIFSLTRSF